MIMYRSGNKIVDSLLFLEEWGRMLQSNGPFPNKILAWFFVLAVTIILVAFYLSLSHAQWTDFLLFLAVDGTVNFASLTVLLLGPVSDSLLGISEQEEILRSEEDDILLLSSDTTMAVINENSMLTPQDTTTNPSRSRHDIFSVPQNDYLIQWYAAVGFVALASSILSDTIVTFSEKTGWSLLEKTAFVIADVVEDSLYMIGFVSLSIAYRVIALRVWILRETLEEVLRDDGHDDARLSLMEQEPPLLRTLSQIRESYELAFEASEYLSAKTTVLALALISLVFIEMVSTVQQIFHEGDFELDLEHVALLRLVLVLSALILSIASAAADVMFASERLSETMSMLECKIRARNGTSSYYQQDNSVSLDPQVSTTNLEAANLLKALVFRVRTFPVRISAGWMHLTTEWAMGVTLLALTTLLAIIGIKMPGGE